MKKRTLLFTLLSILLITSSGIAQVSFTSNTSLLGTFPGWSYEDCVVDMNGDFLDDVVRISDDSMAIDFQNADGTFSQQKHEHAWSTLPNWSICAGDFDNNGYNDLLLGGGSTVSFINSNGSGTDYTEDFHTDYIFSQRSTIADIDNDGHLDAFVCHDVDLSHPYRNDGTGMLTEDQTLIETIDMPGNYAAIWCDFDNDEDMDLYITKCRQGSSPGDPERTNGMYQNDGSGVFTEMAESINMADNEQSWATTFEDYDNDGDFDAFIVNHTDSNRFMLNDGTGYFTDIIATTGIDATDLGAWENASADFDNDGWVDILTEFDNALWLNNGDLTFTGQSLSFDDGGIGDLNNDGFLDVLNGSTIYMNDGNANNWVKINTLGVVSNKNGIGARVELYGDWGMQIREVRSGESFSPMSSLTTHFGIGQSTSIDSVIIKWPSGITTIIWDLDINSTHDIVEVDNVGIEEAKVNPLNIWPNPTSGEFWLHASDLSGTSTVEIMNNNGAVVESLILKNRSDVSIDLKDHPAGIYIVQVLNNDQRFTKRINLIK
ncbi:MAG: hypothetical protein ACI9FU_000700 [Granulosicoccus sp.]|jgi:hypothetical protein